MDTIEVIREIALANPEISAFQIVGFEAQKDLAREYRHSWTDADEHYYQEALSLRSALKLPFWNSLMLSIKNGSAIPDNCLKGASNHHSITQLEWIESANICQLSRLIADYSRLAINSRVQTESEESYHIPMLDFHIEVTERNTELIKHICHILAQPGYLLNSGNSYHFIGEQLVTEKKLISFLGQSLLFTPIIDEIWIAHQLMDRSCSLRFTMKNGHVPTVIEKV